MANNGQAWRKQWFITVSVDYQPEGFNFCCWMSTQELWSQELIAFPNAYIYSGDLGGWHIHSNIELTSKMIVMVGEQAESIIVRQTRINYNRKVANR